MGRVLEVENVAKRERLELKFYNEMNSLDVAVLPCEAAKVLAYLSISELLRPLVMRRKQQGMSKAKIAMQLCVSVNKVSYIMYRQKPVNQ